jgi:hypothetical protein
MKHTSETLETYACNMPLEQLQHVQHPLIYFCNIYMKQKQHISETSETLETYICNVEEGKARPDDSDCQGLGEEGARS